MRKLMNFVAMLMVCMLMAAMVAAQTSSPTPSGPAVPLGTVLMVRLDTTLASFSNKAGDPF
ncbi:MAG: hypothetical protein WAN03_04675, partial [Candidatus Sulfotelmatobacter sp.]